MNKDEFLRQLEVLLSGISQEERTEALAFYRSYFEDAGEANEAKILEELESPQKVADSIIKDLGVQPGEACFSLARREHRQEQSGIRQCRAHRREQQQEQSGIRQCGEQRRTHRREYHREQRRMQRILRRRRMECRMGDRSSGHHFAVWLV